MPKPVDKFGNSIYAKPYRDIKNTAIILKRIGYKESERKPNLFYYKGDNGILAFADMRSTYMIPIWKDTRPLFYVQTNVQEWKRNRFRRREMARLSEAGIEVRRSYEVLSEPDWDKIDYAFEHDISPEIIGSEFTGYCRECGKDFRENGYFCSEECHEKHELKEKLRRLNSRPRCEKCGMPVNSEDLIKHHIKYNPEKIVPVHRSCHAGIHAVKDHPLKPQDRPKKQGKTG